MGGNNYYGSVLPNGDEFVHVKDRFVIDARMCIHVCSGGLKEYKLCYRPIYILKAFGENPAKI